MGKETTQVSTWHPFSSWTNGLQWGGQSRCPRKAAQPAAVRAFESLGPWRPLPQGPEISQEHAAESVSGTQVKSENAGEAPAPACLRVWLPLLSPATAQGFYYLFSVSNSYKMKK